MAITTNHIDVSDLDKFQKILAKIDPSNAEAEAVKRIRKIIANALKKAQKEAESSVGASIPHNQRHAEKAVRARSYSRRSEVLGGILTTLRGKRSGGGSGGRSIPPTKSGRNREWSERTKQMWGYSGADAQFLLYWLAVGTQDRQAGVGRANKRGEYGTKSTSSARQKYFGGTHNVGRINPDTANYNLTAILERIVSSDVIQQINEVYNNIGK